MARANAQLGINLYAETRQVTAASRELQREIDVIGKNIDRFNGEADKMLQKTAEADAFAQQIGVGFLAAGAAIFAGFGMATKAAMDWELAFADVRKTTNASDLQLGKLEDDIRGLARTMPVAHEELARIASIAGQLGVEAPKIASFTETVANMAVATTLTADEAAFALARFSNVMGVSVDDTDRLASTIVHLGNNLATTETEIVSMATNAASAGAVAGFTAQEVLALSSSLSATGIHAEAGGTSLGRFMLAMSDATRTGGDNLEKFASVAGLTADEFKQAYEEDASKATLMFVKGLDGINKSGGDVTGTLKDLGLNEIRVRRALLSMAQSSGTLEEALGLANDEWDRNEALIDEVSQRYETAHMRVKTAQGAIKDAAISLGDNLIPIVAEGAEKVADYGRAWADLEKPQQDAVGAIAGAGGAVATLVGGLLTLGPQINGQIDKLKNLKNASTGVGRAMGNVASFLMGPWGLAIGAAVAASALILDMHVKKKAAVLEYADALRESEGALDENIRLMIAEKAANEDLVRLRDEAGAQSFDIIEAITNENGKRDEELEKLQKIADSQETQINNRGEIISTKTGEAGAADKLIGKINAEADSYDKATEKADDFVRIGGDVEDAQSGVERHIEDVNEDLDENIKLLNDMNKNYFEFTDASFEVEDAFRRLDEALDENGGTLDENTEAGFKNWRQARDTVDAINEKVDAHYRETGSAEDAAEMADELTDRFRDQLEAAGVSKDKIDKLTGGINDYDEVTKDARDTSGEFIDKLRDTSSRADILHGKNGDLIDSTEDLISDFKDLDKAVEDGGKSMDDARKEAVDIQKRFLKLMDQMGYTEDQARDLWDEMREGENIKVKPQIDVSAKGSWIFDESPQSGFGASRPGFRTGGAVFGGGTPTSDSIDARLSRGEHVLTAQDVEAMGGQDSVYAFRSRLHGRHRKTGVPKHYMGIHGEQGQFEETLGFAKGGAPDYWYDWIVGKKPGKSSPSSRQLRSFNEKSYKNINQTMTDMFNVLGDEMGRQWKDMMESFGGTGQAADVIRVARKYVGLSGRPNKFSRGMGFPYGPWCGGFISGVFKEAGALGALNGITPTGGGAAVVNYVRKLKSLKNRRAAKPGDLAAYRGVGPGRWGHINLVYNGRGQTIGGNEGNRVGINNYNAKHQADKVLRPNYAATASTLIGGMGKGGNAVFTSFWDPQTASGIPMNSKTIASSYLPLGSRVWVSVGGRSATGTIQDLGPSKFVYNRHKGKAVLDLNEIMMKQLTGARSNVVYGNWKLLSVGSGRTLYGKRLRGYDTGGVMQHGEAGMNLSGKNERVLDPRQTMAFERLVDILDSGDGINRIVNITQNGVNGFSDVREVKRAMDTEQQVRRVGGNR